MRNLKNNSVGSRVKAVLTTAIGACGLGFASQAMGAIATVQSIATTPIGGSTTNVSNVSGVGGNSGYNSTHNYKETYMGEDLEITKINTATNSYVPAGLANSVVERNLNNTQNNDVIWYQGSGTPTSSTLTFMSAPVNGVAAAFSGNNILVGSDNLFSNQANAQGNNTNIERLDMLFPGGIKASAANAFAIFERGFTAQHDAFKMAAITALDGSGNPLHYGALQSFGAGAWGAKDVVGNQEYIVTRKTTGTAQNQHPSDGVTQPLGGVLVTTDSLATAGTTIYGYSLFGGDVTGAGDQLVNWNNTTFFPMSTSESNGGGLDAVGTTGVLFTSSAVPEPTTGTMALLGISGILARRGKRKQA